MKIRTDFYPTTNRLFWIYENDGEYYLLDSLPHPILGILGFYRSIIFKMKARKISREEAIKYKNPKYKNTGEVVGASAGFCILLGNKLSDYLEKIIVLIDPNLILILFFFGFFIILLYLKIHRKKGGYDKLEYTDVKIKISSRGKGLKNFLGCHLFCLGSILVFIYPHLVFNDIIKNGEFLNLSDLTNLIFCLIFYEMMSLIPVLPIYTNISIIKLDRDKKG